MSEREITSPTSLTLPNGRLNRDAVGWARQPLLNTDGIGGRRGWGRNKRWEYWCVITPRHIVALVASSIDYADVHEVWLFDRATRKEVGANAIAPLGGSITMPGTLGQGPVRVATKNLSIAIDELGASAGTRLQARTPRVRLDVIAERPAGHECLAVVVPWSARRFQYTVKDVARPVAGSIWLDEVEIEVPAGQSWAVLDHGRGRWPYSVKWNWGAASGISGGHTIGLQLGGQWTSGTGSTENAVLIDQRLHKISQELVWNYTPGDWLRPWTITGPGLDLLFEPDYDKASTTRLGVISTRTDQCFGRYSGWYQPDAGPRLEFADLYGWAEDVHNRW